ncbi:hypothetical protein HDF24_25195 [Mucilaginibacter sp. X4EP1]|uniref:hypothetical protein n=1 Tax=Mucilaginibacter sp. X4EP1 TaxID=2723092 RepID=UPI002168BAAF|nr:hypothetical protein [Mucilaginibacter sp. X4EP1]MCS3815092.1 hypothetical protein [Mucilaginibacter sp. X4EP1]
MLNIFLALWLAFACPAHHNSDNNGNHPIVQADSDLGGDNGNPPPPPPPPGS